MSPFPTRLRRIAAAALFAATAALLALPAQAQPIQVRDGHAGNVFSGNGVGSTNLTIRVDGTDKSVAAGAFFLEHRPNAASPWTSFLTYCLEPDETLGINAGQIYNGELISSVFGSSEYGAAASSLARLYATWFADSLTTAIKSAAFQVALWELAYDTGRDLLAGRFILASNTSVRNQANAYLNDAAWLANGDVGAILRIGNQDLLLAVPEPAAAALFGAGLLGLGFALRRRRRLG
jgi:hypothetical protein